MYSESFLPDVGIHPKLLLSLKDHSSSQHPPNLLASLSPLSNFNMVTLTDDGAHGSSPSPASLGASKIISRYLVLLTLFIAIDELFARLDIGPRSARTILRALLDTAYSDIRAPVPDSYGDALGVLGFGASDPHYAPASDDEEIVVIDSEAFPNASAATLRPASPADSGNSAYHH